MGERGPRDEATRAPEKVVVDDPPPKPDYPRYRAEPGERLPLLDVKPGESEQYEKKKDVTRALEAWRRRIQGLQKRLYARNEQGLLVVLQAKAKKGRAGVHAREQRGPGDCSASAPGPGPGATPATGRGRPCGYYRRRAGQCADHVCMPILPR